MRAVAFEFEQQAFGFESSGKAGEVVVGTDDAVAGDEDADAIGSDGLRHSSDAFGCVNAQGDVFVGTGLAIGDLEECVPYSSLEVGAYGMQGDAEGAALAGEVFIELVLGLAKDVGWLFFEFCVEQSHEPALVALGTRAAVPVAQTEFVAC